MTIQEAKRVCVTYGKYRGYPIEGVMKKDFLALVKLMRRTTCAGEFKTALEVVKRSDEFRTLLRQHQYDRTVKRMLCKWAVK